MKILTNELIQKFKNYLYEEEKSDNTIEKYIRDVTAFMVWLCGTELTKAMVLEYKKSLNDTYAPASINSMLSSLNTFFDFCDWHECKVKTLKIQRQIFADKSKELSKTEYEKLLIAAKDKKNERLYYLMQTICSTGIRISELSYITKEAVLDGQATIRCKGKLRKVFLPKNLCGMLKIYIKEQGIKNGAIFITKSGKPLDRSYIWKMLKALCESAGVSKKKVFPHNFRHLFARTYYSLQKDIVRLSDVLGHSSINTTRLYTMESGLEHQKQLQNLGLLLC